MWIQNHSERVPFILTDLGHYPVILGIKWLQKHDVTIKWGANMVLLNSPYCKKNYLESGRTAIVPGIINISNTPAYLQPKEPPLKVNSVMKVKKMRKWTPARTQRSRRRKAREQGASPPEPKKINLYMIGAATCAWYSRKKDYQLLAILLRDIDKALEDKKRPDPATLLPEDYHDLIDVFSRAESDKLPPHRPYNYDILLMPGTEPPA